MKTIETMHNNLVVEGGVVKQFFSDMSNPDQYIVTDKIYANVNLTDFVQKRNIDLDVLGSLVTCLPDGAIIAGGSVMSVLSEKHGSSDIDIFFTSGGAFLETYDLLLNPPDAPEAWAWRGYKPDINRADLLTHSKEYRTVNFTSDNPERKPIQLIKMVWFEKPSDVIDSFDFTVCQFSVTNTELIFNPVALVDLQDKELIIHRYQSPLEMMYRVIKYIRKGYKMSNKTIVNVCEGIRDAKKLEPDYPIANYN